MGTGRFYLAMIRKYLGIANGYAADVGASNGWCESTTLELEQAGWKVLCVEPIPEFATEARSRRKMVAECACADYAGMNVNFTVCGDGLAMQAGSGLTVMHHKIPADWKPGPERTIRVQVETLDKLLKLHSFPRLDFLSVDVEGLEDVVLRGANLAKWLPRLICCENWPGDNKSDAILCPLGYTLVELTDTCNDWYVL